MLSAFRRLVFTAVIAGSISGGFVSLVHHVGTTPIIARAEAFEEAASGAGAAHVHGADAAPHAHGEAPTAGWAPQAGVERTAYTVLASVVTAIAFSLLMVAGFELRGKEVTPRTGLLWGLSGFAAFALAPGLGLPPELPGTASAPLAARQVWWVLTVAATGGGLALLLLQRRLAGVLAGVALLAAPHLYGAPQPLEYGSAAPESLSHQFRTAATLTSLLFWVLLGLSAGFFHGLLKRPPAAPRVAGALGQGS